jgi:hypothetical protein
VPVNVSRTQFWSLSPEEQRLRKRVQFVTPATFRTDPSARVTPEVSGLALLALDIDDPAQARPFVTTPSLLAERLHPLAFAAYTTASSRPTAPKLRVLVPTAPGLPATAYPDAVRTLAARLGLTTVTPESLIAVQPMYLPVMFAGEDAIVDHPLIAHRLEGSAFGPSDVTPSDPTTPDRPGPSTDLGDDTLDHLRPTVDGVTLEDAADALNALDPDCSYLEWLEVAAALRHQFPGKQEPAAYALFDKWSSTGLKYLDADDTAAKWKSLRVSPKGRAPITIRSLLHRAAEAGWSQTGVNSKVHTALTGWLDSADRTAAELLSQGIQRIAAAPLLDAITRSSLLSRLRDRLAKMGTKLTLSDLKKSLRKLEHEAKPKAEKEPPRWTQGVCYVAGANEFYFRNSNRTLGPEALDNVYGVKLLGEDDQHTGRPSIRPRDFLLNLVNIPRVDHYAYDPTRPEDAFITVDKKRFVNLYLPTYPEPDAADADAAGEVLMDHVANLVTEPSYRRVILDFLAFCVQSPGAKIRWTILLQGAQGCGKTAIAEAMRSVLGRDHVSMVDAAMLFTQFNTWAADAQLVAIEEIRIIGHNRHEVMDRLKPCISNDVVTINGKQKALRLNVPNVTNYIMFTNHHDSLAVAAGDRRYFVVNSAIQEKEQVVALGPDYFPRLFKTIRERAPGLRSFLEQWGISPAFDPHGHAPVTKYLGELMSASATPMTAAIQEAIQDGDHPLVQTDLISSRALKAILDSDGHRGMTIQHIGTALRELNYQQVGRVRVGERRHWLWSHQPLTADAARTLAETRNKGEEDSV